MYYMNSLKIHNNNYYSQRDSAKSSRAVSCSSNYWYSTFVASLEPPLKSPDTPLPLIKLSILIANSMMSISNLVISLLNLCL